MSAAQIAMTLRAYVKGEDVTKYREAGEEYDLTVRLPKSEREWIKQLESVKFINRNGALISFPSVATVVPAYGPVGIARESRQRIVTVDANASGDRPLSAILGDIEERLTQVRFPEGYRYEFGGAEKNRRETFGGLGVALALGILFMYVILGIQFESAVQPLVILTAVPMEVIGAFGLLLLIGMPVSIIAFLGILMLTGIVVSNSILLVDYTNVLRRQGMERQQALVQAGTVRLRPVLMTALATIFAMIPVALGLREGGEMLQPLAVTVIGGLTGSTFLTLLVVPAIYSLGDDLSRLLGFRPVEMLDKFEE